MANPNIVNVSTILGKTACVDNIPTTAGSLAINSSSSGKILKVNSLIIANIDGTNSADVTVTVRNGPGSAVLSTIASAVAVPAEATLVLLSKDTSIYLQENMSLYVQASVAGDLSATCSYEEIS